MKNKKGLEKTCHLGLSAMIAICGLFIHTPLHAQTTQKQSNFIKSLLQQEITDGPYTLNTQEKPYSIDIKSEDDPYSVSFNILSSNDLNKDGVPDYVIERNSSGMLGGNVNTNGQIIYYIMKDDKTVMEKYEILSYAPFSYNILEEVTIHNNILTANASQNHRVYNDYENLKSTKLRFIYKDSMLYESSYLSKCGMANMKNRSFFKAGFSNVVKEKSIDMHNYTSIYEETHKTKDTTIKVTTAGCDNFYLTLDYRLQNLKMQDTSDAAIHAKILASINYLADHSNYKTALKMVHDSYRKVQFQRNTSEAIDLKNGWEYNIRQHFAGNELEFTISLQKINNENQIENWDIVTRRK